jgi:hypothetical protein
LIEKSQIQNLKNQELKRIDFENLQYQLKNTKINIDFADNNKKIEEKKAIFIDVYNTLKNKHYNKDNLDEIKMLNNAIE